MFRSFIETNERNITQATQATLPAPCVLLRNTHGVGNYRVSVLLSSTHRRLLALRNSGTRGSRIRLNTEPLVQCSHIIRPQLCRPIQFPRNNSKDHIGLSAQINEASRFYHCILIRIQVRSNISISTTKAIDRRGAC